MYGHHSSFIHTSSLYTIPVPLLVRRLPSSIHTHTHVIHRHLFGHTGCVLLRPAALANPRILVWSQDHICPPHIAASSPRTQSHAARTPPRQRLAEPDPVALHGTRAARGHAPCSQPGPWPRPWHGMTTRRAVGARCARTPLLCFLSRSVSTAGTDCAGVVRYCSGNDRGIFSC